MTKPDDTARRKWLAMLAKLTAPLHAVEATKALCDMLPFLQDLPDGAFTLASLEHTASACRHGCPAYGDLRVLLAEWWYEHRQAPSNALPAPMVQMQQEHQRTAESQAQCRADWSDENNIRSTIRQVDELERERNFMAPILRSMVRTAVGRWAPGNMGLLPPGWLAEGNAVGRGRAP